MLLFLRSTGFPDATLMIPLVTLMYLLHFFTGGARAVKRWLSSGYHSDASEVRRVVFVKVSAVFFFAAVPILIIRILPGVSLADYSAMTSCSWQVAVCALIAAAVILPLNYFFYSPTASNLKVCPQFRIRTWNCRTALLSSLAWSAYLVAYEFMFRGLLLFSCLRSFGLPAALIINVCLYALSHLPKGIRETIGSVPFGLILCLLVVRLESFWIAAAIHIILAVSNDLFSMRANPDMEYIPKKASVS